MSAARIVELDALRAMAVIAIIICHFRNTLPQHSQSDALASVEMCIGSAALGLFFFLSGYTLALRNHDLSANDSIAKYLKKRVARIYPLYWLSLSLTLLTQSLIFRDLTSYDQITNASASQILICITGFQVLLKNSFAEQNIGVFWFVGAILLLYLIFPPIVLLAQRIRRSKGEAILIASLVPFIVLAIFSLLTRTVDDRLFIFYWFFVSGMAVGTRMDILEISFSRLTKLSLFFISLIISLGAMLVLMGEAGQPWTPLMSMLVRYSTSVLLGMAGVTLSVAMVIRLRRMIAGPAGAGPRWVGQYSYSIYLFHLLILESVAYVAFNIDPALGPLMVIIIGIPLTLIIPPFIEKSLQYAISRIKGDRMMQPSTARR